jgi:hypothetical protein
MLTYAVPFALVGKRHQETAGVAGPGKGHQRYSLYLLYWYKSIFLLFISTKELEGGIKRVEHLQADEQRINGTQFTCCTCRKVFAISVQGN